MHDRIHVIIECDILECRRIAHVNKRVAKVNGNYGEKFHLLGRTFLRMFWNNERKKAWRLSFEQFSGVSKIFMCVNWNRNMIQGHCDDVYRSHHVESGKHKNLLRSRLNCTYTHTEIQIDNLFSVFVGY